MKRFVSLILCAAFAAAILTGCANGIQAQELTEQAQQIQAENAIQLDLTPCADFTPASDFGMKLFAETLKSGDENPVISPVSAYLCLAMVMLGTEGETLQEFENVLGGDTAAVASLAHDLFEKLMDVEGNTILNIANSLWADDDKVIVQPSFVQGVTDYFDGEIYQADLPSKEALDDINAWVNDKTEGLIPTLHDEPYPENTALVLLNTLYMKAEWQRMFEGYATRDKTFTKTDGAQLTVPFMQMYEENQQYIGTDDAEGILLPYDDGKTAFVALRSRKGTARDLATGLTAEALAGYVEEAEEKLVNFSMPKFNLAYELYLTDALKTMGLERAFDMETADLSPMGTGVDGPLFLSWVFQKVKIEVNEEGTEAAAVTEAMAATGAAMPMDDPIDLHLDSPFVYCIIDLETGAPLFIGLLEDPAAE